jgi:hypothetical protein
MASFGAAEGRIFFLALRRSALFAFTHSFRKLRLCVGREARLRLRGLARTRVCV